MRTVLIGSDFMYHSDGSLRPIEINTNVTYNPNDKVEDDNDVFDFTNLANFIRNNNFSVVIFIGMIKELDTELKTFCEANSLTYTYYEVGGHSLTVPYIEDNDQTLIIRSAFDTTAIIDDTYCADKVNFVKLIVNQSFGLKYITKDSDGTVDNQVTSLPDNGNQPNFILRARYPGYDTNVYPKIYKVTTQEQLNNIIENELTSDYILTEYAFNGDKLFNNTHIPIIRSYNILYPPTLESFSIGQMTSIPESSVNLNPEYDNDGLILNTYRPSYLAHTDDHVGYPKLRITDNVLMADGTWKSPDQIQVGDVLKTISIPNPNNVNLGSEFTDFGIDIDTFNQGVTYTTDSVTDIRSILNYNNIVDITFTDGTVWSDGGYVFFLTYENNDVRWSMAKDLAPGDQMIAIDTDNETQVFSELKTIASIDKTKNFFDGWVMSVENNHLFIVKDTTTETANARANAFAFIEHNVTCPGCIRLCSIQCGQCAQKQYPACQSTGTCVSQC